MRNTFSILLKTSFWPCRHFENLCLRSHQKVCLKRNVIFEILHKRNPFFIKNIVKCRFGLYQNPQSAFYLPLALIQYVAPNLRITQKYAFIKKSSIFTQSLRKLVKMWYSCGKHFHQFS